MHGLRSVGVRESQMARVQTTYQRLNCELAGDSVQPDLPDPSGCKIIEQLQRIMYLPESCIYTFVESTKETKKLPQSLQTGLRGNTVRVPF